MPTLIVLTVSLVMSLQAAAVYYALGPAVDDIINAVILLGGYYFLEAIGLWMVFSFALYLLTVAAGGHPLLGHIFRVVGWGMLPFVGTGFAWAVGQYYALKDVPPPELTINSRIEHETNAMGEYMGQATGDPVLVGAMIVGGLFLIASGYYWTIGLTRAGDLDRRRAAVVAAIPIAAFFSLKFLMVAV